MTFCMMRSLGYSLYLMFGDIFSLLALIVLRFNKANLKLDLEKNKKLLAEYKKRIDVLLREKEDAGKENQQLSRQLDEIKQGKSSTPDTTSEQVMKEEKDTRIQVHLKL
ncbi:uncharacterized protein LOC124822085 [Vigna umbellata]|uniref:uncharacterized protein LOC124822085 n=1 Tax=Vigna umbellata TaxID=87088 RepID=UPI001F5E9B67|nr:uncharacterized protein LOC124822085 [Vigna umbellata]